MPHFLNWIHRNRLSLIVIILGFGGFIIFEAFQQLYYALNFNNGATPNITFIDVLIGGAYRWLIWLVIAVPIALYHWKAPIQDFKLKSVTKFVTLIVMGLGVNLLLVTLTSLGGSENLSADFLPQLEFYFFHKAPIILVSLIFLSVMIHYFKKDAELKTSFEEIGGLKVVRDQLYDQLKNEQVKEEDKALQVRIGNKTRLVPLQSIVWVEADDYCVKIHNDEGNTFTLRSTLKALSSQLPLFQFVRVHRKAIVNLHMIEEYSFGNKSMVRLNNGLEIPLAQSRVKDFKGRLQNIA